MIASNSPDAWWRLICRRLKSSSVHRELLHGGVHDAPVRQHLPQPPLHRAPVNLHLSLRLDLLSVETLFDAGGLGAQRGGERVGEAVGGVRGEHDRPQSGRGAPPRRRGGDAGLAHAALARIEDDPGRLHERLRLPPERWHHADRFRAVLYPAPLTAVRE
jgi:hypothetical protein